LFLKAIHQKKYGLELTPHGGLTPEWPLFSQPTRFVKKWYHTTLGVWLINASVDKVRAVSEWEAMEIRKIGVTPEKVVVIANGIEDIAFQDSTDHISPETVEKVGELGDFIVTLSRIDPVKNIETIIRALPLINTSVKLVVLGPVGEMNYYQMLKNLAEKLLVSDRVIFYGEVTGFEKYYILSKAQAMVHMSICESYCIAVREGMSQGLICVVADNSALKEFVENDVNGYKVGTLDWEELARRMNLLLTPTAEGDFDRIKRYNKQQSLKTTWDAIGTQLSELYQQLIKQINA
jgi:glycosyltransferase involved in cell wall biosynthesis